ncbi:phospho-acceptor domain-containing protein [Kordia periserrulae]|uniref:histidine kinase n=1 Tax=Kordia periserrulae TaxID=701523 RepID=A0A2T6BYJ9_9FLAO|nr:ATP-binding protein [Kordia periserrulae]PTX61128.1 phospho-acceptor domain-containing protein [Kordia periserrulae]
MTKNVLQNIGSLKPFEIRNSYITLILGAPSTYIYLEIIKHYNPDIILPFYGNIVFALIFLLIGISANFRVKFILQNYGWLVFGSTMAFQHYLTYATHLNNFSLDILLVNYVFVFGSVLLLSNRILVLIYSFTEAIHLAYVVYISDLDAMRESAILLSTMAIFICAFWMMNGFIRYQRKMELLNSTLEDTVQQHTLDLEIRAKELLEKNKDLEEFAYVVSHDLKRPLRNIYTLTDWLSEDDDEQINAEAIKSLQQIKGQVAQMDLLVEGILNYSLQAEPEQSVKEVNLHTTVKRIVDSLAGENVSVSLEKKLPRVLYNESQIQQIFFNLLQNAIKHNDKEHIEISIDYEVNKLQYKFFIKDNGPGIAEKYHGKIFELFQKLQTDVQEEAIGIGLALVKKIVERNDGKIYVKSTEGNGATFIFTIPKK